MFSIASPALPRGALAGCGVHTAVIALPTDTVNGSPLHACFAGNALAA